MPCHAILINSEFLTWALRYGDETALQVGGFVWLGWVGNFTLGTYLWGLKGWGYSSLGWGELLT